MGLFFSGNPFNENYKWGQWDWTKTLEPKRYRSSKTWYIAWSSGLYCTFIVPEVNIFLNFKLALKGNSWVCMNWQQFRGGATMHGPKPRSHAFKLNKKVRRLGLKIALSARAAEGKASVTSICQLLSFIICNFSFERIHLACHAWERLYYYPYRIYTDGSITCLVCLKYFDFLCLAFSSIIRTMKFTWKFPFTF